MKSPIYHCRLLSMQEVGFFLSTLLCCLTRLKSL